MSKNGYPHKQQICKAAFFRLLPGPSRRLAQVIKCSLFLSFFQRYIVRDISLTWDIAGSLLLGVLTYPPFWKARGMEDWVNRKTIAFWGTTRSPAFTMHKFMNENLKVKIWRDNFTSDYLRVNLPSRNLSRKSDLSKLSTLSEPSIVKFIENQSEHLSKLTLYHLKKRATRWSRRSREPSRISLLFLRGLNKKNNMLKKFVEVFKAPSLC